MQEPISPDLFLFQRLVIDMLDHCKKNLKVAPFEDMEVMKLVDENKKQRIDIYHQYFLIGISHNKTRQYIAKNYERLIRDNLINNDYLPPQMISGILNAKASAGSTASSGSVAGSSSFISFQKSVHIGKLISTIICSTIQPSSQIITGLNFLLEGTKTKQYGSFFNSSIEEVYKNLTKYRQKPLDRFLKMFLGNIEFEAEYHLKDSQFKYRNRKQQEKHNKMCVHSDHDSKFGKCFICEKPAKNYDKNVYVPLCSIQCKNKLKHINEECLMNDHFNIFGWLLQTLPQNFQIIYELFVRQVQQVELSDDKINSIILTISSCLSAQYIGTKIQHNTVLIFCHLVKKYHLMRRQNYYEIIKVFFIQIIRLIQITPLTTVASSRLYLLQNIVSLLQLQQIITTFYIRCDCSLFQYNIVQRILNALSQYTLSTENQLRQFGIRNIYKFLQSLARLPQKWKGDESLSVRKKLAQKKYKNKISSVMDYFNNEDKKPQKAMNELKKIFNENLSHQEIAYIIRQNLDYDAQIKKKKTFKKERVGEYFSAQNPQIESIYTKFLQFIDFNGLQGDDILRIVFNIFTLPKEGQRVQRIFTAISKICQPLLGLKEGDHTYLFLYLLLMTHTSNTNKNMKQGDKIKLQNFLKLCGQPEKQGSILGLQEPRKVQVYNRIIRNPLQNRYVYKGHQLFEKKHLIHVKEEVQWLTEQQTLLQNVGNPFKSMLMNIWEYIYISIVNKNNMKGLYEAAILYGRAGLRTQFEAFLNNIYKIYENQKTALSHDAMILLLKLGVDTGNYTLGINSWLYIIKVVYKIDDNTEQKQKLKTSDFEYQISDRLFTRTRELNPDRLKQFLQAMCEFSSSQFKTDSGYTRELYTLHHIAEVIEYNVKRLSVIWQSIWGTLESYFRDICLHPRKQIAMSAIDSFKQFTIKVFKLSNGVDHGQVMDAYLYIFERSNAFMKDLIVNILLNVVGKDMKSGWDSLYTILQVVDSEDKGVVMRVINRLINDVDLQKIGNLRRLHSILVKELRTANEDNLSILNRLWQVSKHFNEMQIWIQTLKCIKDIYKIRVNNNILQFVYKICNTSIQMLHQHPNKQIQAQIYEQILQIQIFITQIKSSKLFSQAINKFTILSPDIVIKNLGNFLSYWDKFYLYCANFQQFCYFFVKYIRTVFERVKQNQMKEACEQICFWTSKIFTLTYPDQLFQLCDQDIDLNLGVEAVLHKGITSNKVQLIEFSVSSRQYTNKTIIHLVFLEIKRLLYEMGITNFISESCNEKLKENIIQSYVIAKKLNNKIMLRNFLWNNDFLKSNEENSYLPNFTKQELRTCEIIIKYYDFTEPKINQVCYGFLVEYCKKMSLYVERNTKNKNPSQLQELIYQDLGMWLSNSNQTVQNILKRCIQILKLPEKERSQVHALSDLLQLCLELNLYPISKNLLKENSELMSLLISELY